MFQHFLLKAANMPQDSEKLARETATFDYKYIGKKIM